jgi:RNA polymerase sigma-70 factor (ECF subfamily)
VRADLLRRLGHHDAARKAYLAASAATQLEPLRRLYARRIAELDRVAAGRTNDRAQR